MEWGNSRPKTSHCQMELGLLGKKIGGLGVRNLALMNNALLCKLN